ncbi:apolipoprotein L1 isoform X2 [Acanthopagrus latus]|uniref:apolipoprotein L1 isoform X2 n=1 Tax=Acanthopagrus latus TaxID=8177 RepID=UPI00187CB300|nr:apolipoprotein L1 isoform X2 [Acanthopagrus latus]
MERYDNLDLDLECDGGGVAKVAIFGGMFKRSSKIAEPSAQSQDTLSVNSNLSKSSDSLSDSSTKEKGGVLKRMFKKASKTAKEGQSQDTLSLQNPELSVSSDSLTDNKSSKEKSGVFGGILKRAGKPGHARRPSQDLLDNDFTASNDSLSENTATKETGGVFSGMFKKKEDLSAPSELSGSTDNLSVNSNTKETGGIFSGMFKKSPKPFGATTQSQEDLSAPNELSGSADNLSVNSNTKEGGGIFSGMFKKKLLGSRTQSQDDLSAPSELSGSTNNLSEGKDTKEKGGIFSGVFRKKVSKSQSQDDLFADGELSASSDSLIEASSKEKGKTEQSGDLKENTEKPKAKQNGFSAMMKSTFYTEKQEKNSDSEEILDSGDDQPSHKQKKLTDAMTKLNPFRSANKHEKQAGSDDEDPPVSSEKSSGNKQNAMVGAMSKLNLFRSANKKDTEDTEKLTEDEQRMEEKPKVVKSNMIQQERKDRSETPTVPPRPTEEEMKRTSTYNKGKPIGAEDNKNNKDMTSREKKAKPEKTPVVPARPSEESQSDDEGLKKDESAESKDETNYTESKTTKVKKHKHNPFMPRVAAKASSDDEGLKEDDDSSSKEEKNDEDGKDKAEETKLKKPKRHNPFMPRVKTSSDDEGLKEEDDSSSKEEKNDEEGKDKTEETNVKKPKRHNPFMPRVKGRVKARGEGGAAGNTAENEGPKRTLFDQLDDYRIDPARGEEGQDVEDLMEWWDTVESWEDTAQDDDMTEKEEAKAFAVTAEKVQKGIRVFNKLFSERAESLWQHVIDLNTIADGLDKFSKKTKIAQITGGSTSAIGGVATIAGLALAPVTMGTSLIVTAVGLGVATAGGLTSAGAGISNQVNNSMDRKKVEKIIKDYQDKMVDLNKCLKFIKQGIENLKKFDLLKMKDNAYNRDFPVLTAQFYEDGAMAGKAILINANEIMRVVQIANVAGSTAARAVQIASMATGVLTGLFVGMDIYFVAKDSKELKKGAKSEFAKKIREVSTQLHDGLVELNGIREELQCTAPENEDEGDDTAALDSDKKEKEDKHDTSEEDEIDRIKKAIKKDYENREYL